MTTFSRNPALSGLTLAALLAVGLAASDAHARLEGGSSGSKSSGGYSSPSKSNSYSSPSRSASPSPSRSDSSRLGSGRSAGMERSGVMDRVRQERAAPEPARVAPRAPAPSYAPAPAPTYPSAPAYSPSRAPSYAPSYAPAPRAPERSGGSWVAPALAGAALGAMAGHALANNSDNSQAQTAPAQSANHQVPAPAPTTGSPSADNESIASGASSALAAAPVAPQPPVVAPAPAKAQEIKAQESSSGSMGSLLMLGGLIAAGLACWAVFRSVTKSNNDPLGKGVKLSGATSSLSSTRPSASFSSGASFNSSASSSTKTESSSAPTDLEGRYRRLQDANNRGDLRELEGLMAQDLFDSIADAIANRDGTEEPTRVLGVHSRVVDNSIENGQRVVSVLYEATIDEGDGPEDVADVYHFVFDRATQSWLLAGIEAV